MTGQQPRATLGTPRCGWLRGDLGTDVTEALGAACTSLQWAWRAWSRLSAGLLPPRVPSCGIENTPLFLGPHQVVSLGARGSALSFGKALVCVH